MKLIRKIDYYGQLILGSLMLLSVPVLLFYGFLAGLFILGCWQLLSAVFNIKAFVHSGHSTRIWTYWSCCIADLAILFLSWYIEKTFDTGSVQVFYWIALSGAVLIAIYYLKIYKDLIQFFLLRDELDGLTKSKH
ncbi:MAG TPA: hypothetical protein VIS75_04565 [Chitinophagaceae bacterium]